MFYICLFYDCLKGKNPSEGRVQSSVIFSSSCSPRDVCKTKRPDEKQKVSSFYFTSHSCQCDLNLFWDENVVGNFSFV